MSDQPDAKRILIIDDQESIHLDFQKILEKSKSDAKLDDLASQILENDCPSEKPSFDSFALSFAQQGEEGFNKVKKSLESGERFQIAFVDMRMPPGWDGLETIEKIWEIDDSIQTVVCTAYSDYSWNDIIDRLGKSDRLLILKKPFDKIEIQQIASTLCYKWQLTHKMNSIIAQQVTTIKEAEKQLHQSNKLSSLGMLASGFAHEINNPLAIISGTTRLLLKHLNSCDKGTDLISHVDNVDSSVKRISAIIENLKGLAEENSKEPTSTFDFSNVLDWIKEMCKQQCDGDQVNFKISGQFPNMLIKGYPSLLNQAMLSILFNARDAIAKIEEAWIKIDLAKEDNQLKISISNNGPKIAADVAENIFDPFFTTKDIGQNQGQGLSLSIVHKIIKQHSGSISINERSEHTEFVIALPLVEK